VPSNVDVAVDVALVPKNFCPHSVRLIARPIKMIAMKTPQNESPDGAEGFLSFFFSSAILDI